jgi:DNA repair protein RadC
MFWANSPRLHSTHEESGSCQILRFLPRGVPHSAHPCDPAISIERKSDWSATSVLEQRLFQRGPELVCPAAVKQYLRLRLASEPCEVFAVLFLDCRHRLQAFETLFQGTIDNTIVYPRYVLQRVLHYNSAAVILAHNHPSGNVEPSQADKTLTQQLKSLLAQVDVRVLDHLIVGSGEAF